MKCDDVYTNPVKPYLDYGRNSLSLPATLISSLRITFFLRSPTDPSWKSVHLLWCWNGKGVFTKRYFILLKLSCW